MKGASKSFLHPILVAGIVLAVLPFVLRWIGSTTTLGTEIAIYALYALGFNLLLGYTGLVSFGASAFFGAASYAAGIFVLHLLDNMYVAILFGTVAAGVLAAPLWSVVPSMSEAAIMPAFVVVTIGGLGSFGGAVISGLLVGISVALSIQFWPAASTAVMYALMIVVLLIRPRGLLGESWERFE